MKPLIYIAGPISKGDLHQNVCRAHEAAVQLISEGYAVYCPHGGCFFGNRQVHVSAWNAGFKPEVHASGITHTEWLEMDLHVIARCDAVLRLPGESVGADMEAAFMRRLRRPVYDHISKLLESPPSVQMVPSDASAIMEIIQELLHA